MAMLQISRTRLADNDRFGLDLFETIASTDSPYARQCALTVQSGSDHNTHATSGNLILGGVKGPFKKIFEGAGHITEVFWTDKNCRICPEQIVSICFESGLHSKVNCFGVAGRSVSNRFRQALVSPTSTVINQQ